MNITLTTPALLFPAISLLLLAYTNRFLAIASLIRQLHQKHLQEGEMGVITGQIKNLRMRLNLIRNMQIFGVLSFFCCVLSMILIYQDSPSGGSYIFGVSLIFLLVSLLISLREVQQSTKALELELSDMELGATARF
ncbi:MAG: DUF2721 domain-containing protein [Cyclobacteriaceae bacterium]|jgi:hypothetical protein